MSKYCPFVHDSIHFTTDGKVANCCLQDTRGFPTVEDVDFKNSLFIQSAYLLKCSFINSELPV